MWTRTLLLTALISVMGLSACNNTPEKSNYLRWVGDIEADPTLDDPKFKVCSEADAMQYHNLGDGFLYDGEMWAIQKTFKEKYRTIKKEGESGWIRIRFIVNCEGQAGRFRLMAADFDYQARTFDEDITTQLMDITKNLDGWVAYPFQDGQPVDYYQYLIFKLVDGAIIDIMP